MSIQTFSRILDGVTVFTLIVQAYVLYLVQFKSPVSMKEYRYFLNTFTVWDMLFTIVLGVVVAPLGVPETLGAWPLGWSRFLKPEFQIFWLASGFYAGAMVIQSQDYCLIYRFTVIWIDKRVHQIFMSFPSKVGWILLQQGIAITLAVLGYFACVQPEDFKSRASQETFPRRAYLDSFVIWIDIEKSKASLYFMGALGISFVVSGTLCTTLLYLIIRTLRKNVDKFSKVTYKLHRQFTILLAMQIISPVAFILLPCVLCITLPIFFGYYSSTFGFQIVYVWMSMYALSNALFTIFYISPYRVHFFKLCKRLYINRFCLRLRNRRSHIVDIEINVKAPPSAISSTSIYNYSIARPREGE